MGNAISDATEQKRTWKASVLNSVNWSFCLAKSLADPLAGEKGTQNGYPKSLADSLARQLEASMLPDLVVRASRAPPLFVFLRLPAALPGSLPAIWGTHFACLFLLPGGLPGPLPGKMTS